MFRVAHAACVVTLLHLHKDIPVIVNDCFGVQSMIVMDYSTHDQASLLPGSIMAF